jgi:hypothetical protein
MDTLGAWGAWAIYSSIFAIGDKGEGFIYFFARLDLDANLTTTQPHTRRFCCVGLINACRRLPIIENVHPAQPFTMARMRIIDTPPPGNRPVEQEVAITTICRLLYLRRKSQVFNTLVNSIVSRQQSTQELPTNCYVLMASDNACLHFPILPLSPSMIF